MNNYTKIAIELNLHTLKVMIPGIDTFSKNLNLIPILNLS
jgi:hypothetical protein